MDVDEAAAAAAAGESVSFPRVAAVASGWMLDFMFVSLCRRFREGAFKKFNEALSVFEAISQNLPARGDGCEQKILVTAFLARVMHGKQLDILFEEDEQVMPLMSATKIWSKLEDAVADKKMFKNISILLTVQSVALCLEKGQQSCASSALEWFENNQDLPQSLKTKLTTVVNKRDIYHSFIMSFSFSRLLETIHSFLDTYLEKNPSDYLIKAATEMILSSQNPDEDLMDEVTQQSSPSEKTNTKSPGHKQISKRKLLSTKMNDLWKSDPHMKPCVSIRKLSKSELSEVTCQNSKGTTEIHKKRKPHRKWTYQLDCYLKAGVRCHGLGKWSQILLDYDFEGRTGTMLKDRWRVLKKAHAVGP